MGNKLYVKALGSAVGILSLLGFVAAFGTGMTSAAVPVISLKPFISTAMWQLDITWRAKDAWESRDMSAKVDMTATARFVVMQSDKRDDWGRWHVEKLDSNNLALTGLLLNKNDKSRTEYRPDPGSPADGGVSFEVGRGTPGYKLMCEIAYPIKIINPLLGSMDSIQTLLTTDIHAGPPVFCTGPLPASGTTISGSLVFPAPVGPFVGSTPPDTRVGISFVLKPYDKLAPLTPLKK